MARHTDTQSRCGRTVEQRPRCSASSLRTKRACTIPQRRSGPQLWLHHTCLGLSDTCWRCCATAMLLAIFGICAISGQISRLQTWTSFARHNIGICFASWMKMVVSITSGGVMRRCTVWLPRCCSGRSKYTTFLILGIGMPTFSTARSHRPMRRRNKG